MRSLHAIQQAPTEATKDQAAQVAREAAAQAQKAVGQYEALKTVQGNMQALFDSVDKNGPIIGPLRL
jgi:hypothetical protein